MKPTHPSVRFETEQLGRHAPWACRSTLKRLAQRRLRRLSRAKTLAKANEATTNDTEGG